MSDLKHDIKKQPPALNKNEFKPCHRNLGCIECLVNPGDMAKLEFVLPILNGRCLEEQ